MAKRTDWKGWQYDENICKDGCFDGERGLSNNEVTLRRQIASIVAHASAK